MTSQFKPRPAHLVPPADDSTATTWIYSADSGSHFASPVLSAAFSSPRASSSGSFPSDNDEEEDEEEDPELLDSAPASRHSDRDEPEHSQLSALHALKCCCEMRH